MAAFEAEVEAICLLLRLLPRGVSCLVTTMHALTSGQQFWQERHRIQLRTAAKHIEHVLFAAMHFLKIEGCE